MPADPHDLARFRTAQDAHGTSARALEELRRGRKSSHWMWFVFPQVAGLGFSPAAEHFGIRSLDEARAYLADAVLGSRLREAAAAAADAPADDVEVLLGGVDALKLRSSMTLFAIADPEEAVFRRVLDRWFDGRDDPATHRLLGRSDPPDTLLPTDR